MKTYFKEYEDLKNKYNIAHSVAQIKAAGKTEDDYDVIVQGIGSGYAHKKYRAIKNKPGLSTQQLAIICDRGNLCFGYRVESGGVICVYID